MRILLIDDNRKHTDYLSRGLKEQGYIVDVTSRGEKGLQLLQEASYDLVILEVVLPGISGFDVLEKLQDCVAVDYAHQKVMFLSSRDSVDNRVRGLKMGADDFVGKPFACSELLARVQALLRRGSRDCPSHFRISDLCIDLEKRQAWRQGKLLNLTAREFALLCTLARRPGQVFTRGVLEDLVWKNPDDIETNVVDVAIRRLRKKVDDPYPNKLIQTRRGLGYLLEGDSSSAAA